MGRKKISPGLQQATEKYLVSIGASRADLSEKQWEVVVKHIKSKRLVIMFLTFGTFGIILAGLSLWAYRLGEKGMASIIPENTHSIKFVSETGEESAPINADDVKNYMKAVVDLYCNWSLTFMLACFSFIYAFTIPLARKANKKMLEAFISHRQETDSPSRQTF